MRRVIIQGAPGGTTESRLRWLESAVRQISYASADNDTIDIATNFTLNATYTTQRSLPASPTLTDVINVLSTLLADLQKGGSTRTG